MPEQTTSSPLILSVVLATFSRAELLRTTLRHLADQTLDPASYEVIVIDDGSPDHTREVVEEAARQSSFPITYLRHDNHGPGYTQNRGIRQARAGLILLIADDILLTPDALQAHVTAHARHGTESVAILGNVRQSPQLQQSVFQRNWDPFELRRLKQDQELPYWLFWACNISLKRDFMLEHGMFRDARGVAGGAAHEDVEVGHRLAQNGLRIFHDQSAMGHHYHVESLDTAIARSVQRGHNWEEVFRLMPHPELLIRQRMYNLGTLIGYRKELTGDRRRYLLGAERSMPHLALKSISRALVFNRFTVPFMWTPLMRLAEHQPLVAKLMRPPFYRGVIVYHFRRACLDARQQAIASPDPSATVNRGTQ